MNISKQGMDIAGGGLAAFIAGIVWSFFNLRAGLIVIAVGVTLYILAMVLERRKQAGGTSVALLFKFMSIAGFWGFFVFYVWGLILAAPIVKNVAGMGWFIVGIILSPVTLVVVPWYALIVQGTWYPLLVTYGGIILSFGMIFIASSLVNKMIQDVSEK